MSILFGQIYIILYICISQSVPPLANCICIINRDTMLLTPRINSRHHITTYITHVSEFFPQRAFKKILATFRNGLAELNSYNSVQVWYMSRE